MATSGTATFNLEIAEVIEEALSGVACKARQVTTLRLLADL